MAVPLDTLSVTRPSASMTAAQSPARATAQPAGGMSFADRFSVYSEDNRPGLTPYGVALDPAPTAAADEPRIAMDRWQPRAERPRERDSTLGLGDMLDALNPLQHIPGVATLYRKITGDEIAPAAKVVGGTIYGGPVGLVSSLVNAVVEQVNGAAVDETALAYVFGEDDGTPGEAEQVVAANDPTASKPAMLHAASAPEAPATGRAAVLTGSDALAAFARDMGRAESAPGSVVTPAAASPADPLPAVGAAPGRGFSAQMMMGLDKYRQMAVDRGGPGLPAVDRRL